MPKLAPCPTVLQQELKKTLIHVTFDVRTEPNPMSSRDPRIAPHDPLKLGCEKPWDMPCSPFNRTTFGISNNSFKGEVNFRS